MILPLWKAPEKTDHHYVSGRVLFSPQWKSHKAPLQIYVSIVRAQWKWKSNFIANILYNLNYGTSNIVWRNIEIIWYF